MPAPFIDTASKPLTEKLLTEVDRYCRDKHVRHACLRSVESQIPRRGDAIVIAHSLGSVLAADLLYCLPPLLQVRLFMTIGSPLGRVTLHSHLEKARTSFPVERVGPWVNVVGRWDPVSLGRGLSWTFPEALDTYVDTGSGVPTAHAARSYLDQDVVADAVDWALTDRAKPSTSTLPERRLPDDLLLPVIQAQFAWRLEREMEAGARRMRFGQARVHRAAEIAQDAASMDEGTAQALGDLDRDHSGRLKGRFEPGAALAVLLSLAASNPIEPYEVRYSEEDEARALKQLANDLGYPEKRAVAVLEAEKAARRLHRSESGWQQKVLLAAGATALLAAPMLVAVAAPAGLAGGAGIVAGLAALGPGGMVGGLGVVGLVGGAGGAAIAGALTLGSAATVTERVILIHALALAEKELHEDAHRGEAWWLLVEMETTLSAERARLARFSDKKSASLRELTEKLTVVRKALEHLASQGLAPAALTT